MRTCFVCLNIETIEMTCDEIHLQNMNTITTAKYAIITFSWIVNAR
jgi:hypothetical protein